MTLYLWFFKEFPEVCSACTGRSYVSEVENISEHFEDTRKCFEEGSADFGFN